MKAIITVLGKDKVGIIATISNILAEAGINILDISQTIMQEVFTMIMVVDTSGSTLEYGELAQRLEQAGKSLELSVKIQHEDIFNSMHRI